MKKNYCEFCGQELGNSKCDCKGLEHLKEQGVNIYNRKKKKCLYCKSKMFTDSNFCPYCGMPNDSVNVFDINLQKSLGYEDENALSHINVEEFKKRRDYIEKQLNQMIKIKILLIIIAVLLSFILVFKYVLPFARQTVLDRQFLENNKIDMSRGYKDLDEEEGIIESSEDHDDSADKPSSASKYKSEWVRRDGNFYAFDEDGEPIVDEWVEEVDEKTGVKSWYYFDIEGKLVTNSWVNNEYYVGADGKMYINTYTPQGIKVGKDGKAILETEPTTTVERTKSTKATQIFYDSPNGDGNVIAVEEVKESTQVSLGSNNTGIIKGDVDKSAAIYISSLRSYTTNCTKNNKKVDIKIYYPLVKGTNSAEVKDINDKYKSYIENGFKDLIVGYITDYQEDLADMTLNTVEEININKNRYWIKVSGRLTKASGKGVNISYRIRYDRNSGVMVGEKMN